MRIRKWRRGAALAGLCGCLGAAAGDPDGAEAWRESGRRALIGALAQTRVSLPARNVILFIGDGMGVSTVTAARILAGQESGGRGEEHRLAFEALPHVALLKTYTTDRQVPDSAGTATALLSGVKTRSGVINYDASVTLGGAVGAAQRLTTLFELAEARGLATGVVSTASLTHATPAAAYAHVSHRSWENDTRLSAEAAASGVRDIARQFVDFDAGDGIDVALGGGRAHFLPVESADPEYPERRGMRRDGRDLAAQWRAAAAGRAIVWSREQLEDLDPEATRQILGLFEPEHMRFEADRGADPAGEPSLAEMTASAIEWLERRGEGYLLLVEAGRIDHGHHLSSAYLALHDTIALSDAVAEARRRVDPRETLIVVTADHGHALAISGYPLRGNPILELVRGNPPGRPPSSDPALDLSGRPYTTLAYATGPGHVAASDQQPAGPKRLPHRPQRVEAGESGRPDLGGVDTSDPRYLQESAVALRSAAHSGEDVPLFAGGPGAHLFHGVQEQSYVFHALVAAFGW